MLRNVFKNAVRRLGLAPQTRRGLALQRPVVSENLETRRLPAVVGIPVDNDDQISEAFYLGSTLQYISDYGDITNGRDVNMYSFDAREGEVINIAVRQVWPSELSTFIRVFDENSLWFRDLGFHDSAIRFQAPRTGRFYVGVSNDRNVAYDPVTGDRDSGFFNPIFDDEVGEYLVSLSRETVTSSVDVQALRLTAPASANPGDNFTVSFDLKNNGNRTISSGINWKVEVLNSSNQVVATLNSGNFSTIRGLAAGETNTVFTSGRLPAGLASGSYQLRATVDSTNSISESNENNNSTTGTIQVAANRLANPISSTATIAYQPDGKYITVGSVLVGSGSNYDFLVRRFNANGSVDATFGALGQARISFDRTSTSNRDIATSVALDSRGRIIVAGYAQNGGTNYDFAVCRLSSNGTLDKSFDFDGKAIVTFDRGGGNDDRASAVVVQADDRIVIAGYSSGTGTGNYDFAIARLNSDGSRDTTFDTDGRQTIAFDRMAGANDRAKSVGLLTDGRIVVGGFSQLTAGGNYDFAVARLNANGSLDTTFDRDGKQSVAFDLGGTRDDRAEAMAIQTDGKVVLAGSARVNSSGNYDIAVARLTTTGALDTTFDTDGKQTVSINAGGPNVDKATGVMLTSDGKIVVAGHATLTATSRDIAFVRLLSNGRIDTTFGTNGRARISWNTAGAPHDDFATGLFVQSDGKIVIVGESISSSGSRGVVINRTSSNGVLDQAFNSGGTFVDAAGASPSLLDGLHGL